MLKIVTYPDPILRQKAEAVENVNDEIRSLVESMAEVMYKDDGIGLAAPQVGVSQRIIVVDAGEGLISLINPEIIYKGEEKESMEEGCLSLPGIRVDVLRVKKITVRGINESGETVEMDAEGLLARVFQHEIDHLDGILIIDHVSPLHRTFLRSKLKRLEKEAKTI